jgi:predicted N-acetyltransferase YhbS
MNSLIRPLDESEFEAADRVLRAAFERETSFLPLLRMTKSIEPEGLWCAVDKGQIVGTVSEVDYGQIAYIGLMAVAPGQQRRGIARRLVEHVLGILDDRKCPTVLLDATAQGAPLYASLGFVDDHTAFAFERVATIETFSPARSVRPAADEDLPAICDFDRPIFGADRSRLLSVLWSEHRTRCLVAHDGQGRVSGYLFARDPVLGPWAALDPAAAGALLSAALTLPFQNSPQVLVPRSNALAVELLGRFDFVERRQLRHMRRGGKKSPGIARRLYGQSSFGHG